MSQVSILRDERINATSFLFEINISDYLELVLDIYSKNEYQRGTVKASASVYSLLKDDLVRGCIIPPLVLALNNTNIPNDLTVDEIIEFLKENKKHLLILDGLQRTKQMLIVQKELTDKNDEELLSKYAKLRIRLEVYSGINKLGILYRMLTLNTGQTPMSLRHQVEILYLDYLDKDIDGISLLREIDESRPTSLGEYKFKDVIGGFNSYIERNELPLDRFDVLKNIKGLEKLAQENQDSDLFQGFIKAYNSLVKKINELASDWTYDTTKNEAELTGQAFGRTALKIFNKSQPLTGFGAAVGKLKDFELIKNFGAVESIIENISSDDIDDCLNTLLSKLDSIRMTSTKIGNAQRMYFMYLFRELLNEDTDSYLNLNIAVENAYRKYVSQTA